ncbi:hypothetical protein WJX72_000739 [[Myrmecia] bisecta]|uniref:Bulb-type lectin domain-containing protein n=1 Tax=[Myrmecia] bisecta TaxID=41462 RepID=A0AAW1R3L4_9CHLO
MTGVVLGGFPLAELLAMTKQSNVLVITSNKALAQPAPLALGDATPKSCGDVLSNGIGLIANLLKNKAPTSITCSMTWPIVDYPAFVKVGLSVNLPGVNFVPITGSTGQSQSTPFQPEICEANAGSCTTFCPSNTSAAQGSCGSNQYIQSKVVEALVQSNINLDIAVCLGYTGKDPVTQQLYSVVSTILNLLGLDPCPIHGGVTIFPFILVADGYVQLGIGFVDIRADVSVKMAPEGGFTTGICDYLQMGYDTPADNPAFKQVQCRPWCYQQPGDGTFKVAAELHILWFVWSWTLFQTNFGPQTEPLLCQYPPVGVYGPANGRNDTLYGPAIIPGGTEMISANGNFLLRFSTEGNMELYDSQKAGTWPDVQAGDSRLFSTNTFQGATNVFALLEGGNLQVQDPVGPFPVVWQTGTDQYVLGKPYLTVTNDGRITLRDTYDNKCYWDSTGQCKDAVQYWPAGFSDSLIESTNTSDPNFEPTCMNNSTMLVSKNRKWAWVGAPNAWYVFGVGQGEGPPVTRYNTPLTGIITVTCDANIGLNGAFCISSRKGDYPAFILSQPGQTSGNYKTPHPTWSIGTVPNGADLAGPAHVTIGDDGEFGMGISRAHRFVGRCLASALEQRHSVSSPASSP